jgi:alkylhydroperoxidase family enzyme
MHTKDARAMGETEQRIYALSAWREAPFYSERERAALAWSETVTRIADTHVPDDAYESAREQFSEEELVSLTFAVIAINGWNRLAVSFRAAVGTYQPAAAASV